MLFLGFRDRKEANNLSNRSQPQQKQRKNSVESQSSFRSTGSAGHVPSPPHVSTRVVLGRETSPVPVSTNITDKPDTSGDKRLPREIMDKFSGQSREVGGHWFCINILSSTLKLISVLASILVWRLHALWSNSNTPMSFICKRDTAK